MKIVFLVLQKSHLLLRREAQGVKGNISELQLLGVVDGIHLYLSLQIKSKNMCDVRRPMCPDLGEEEVVIGIGGHEDKFLKTVNDARLDELEEDVVAALVGLLVGHTGLLEEVDVDETTGKFAHVVEIDPAAG